MAGARKLLRTRHSRGARSDDSHAFPGLRRRRKGNDPAFFPALVDDEVLDRFDADRIVVDVQRAGCLTRSGTDASGELRKIIGRMQHIERLTPLVTIDQIVPVRNDVVDGAA